MTYRKPEITVMASAVSAIQNDDLHAKTSIFLDSSSAQAVAPAYEADE